MSIHWYIIPSVKVEQNLSSHQDTHTLMNGTLLLFNVFLGLFRLLKVINTHLKDSGSVNPFYGIPRYL